MSGITIEDFEINEELTEESEKEYSEFVQEMMGDNLKELDMPRLLDLFDRVVDKERFESEQDNSTFEEAREVFEKSVKNTLVTENLLNVSEEVAEKVIENLRTLGFTDEPNGNLIEGLMIEHLDGPFQEFAQLVIENTNIEQDRKEYADMSAEDVMSIVKKMSYAAKYAENVKSLIKITTILNITDLLKHSNE